MVVDGDNVEAGDVYDDDDDDAKSIDKLGNMIAMVCSDGLVVACLKQFQVVDKKDEPLRVNPKKDAEYDKLFVLGDEPKLVLCGLGGQRTLRPLVNKVAEKVLEADKTEIPRPTIENLSREIHEYSKTFLDYDAFFNLFIAGTNQESAGDHKLDLWYLNNTAAIRVPDRYVVGEESHLIRTQIDKFETKTTDVAIDVIKFGFACVARKEYDLKYGYIDVRVIKNNGEVIEHIYNNLWGIVEAYLSLESDTDSGDGSDGESGADTDGESEDGSQMDSEDETDND
ncbi:hypothetical protein MKW98_027965 [Papaver atlanticum]|uniref:Uncharacterized protein n=1 Tax=Papaver atlanticum TaxID=357466 RepID=A0AAD4X781_9MAGN|nr:hypothetical protein MKW98_027965 [Papaver atlanticum]